MTIFKIALNQLHASLITAVKKTGKKTVDYDIKSVCNGEDNDVYKSLTKIKNAPHYKFLTDKNDKTYENYLIKGGEFVGYGTEHSIENYKNLINNFKGYPYENQLIKCIIVHKRLCIVDGVHRASILLWKGNKNDKISVFVENGKSIETKLRMKTYLKNLINT